MKKIFLGLAVTLVGLSSVSFAEDNMSNSSMMMSSMKKAKADIINTSGKKIGTAMFTEVAGGVKINVMVNGLTAGQHGIHIHEFGRCETPTFGTAGEHFRPNEHKHGLKNSDGSHNGDMQNIVIGKNGKGTYMTTNTMLTIGSDISSILRPGGTAIVIHEKADDHMSQPAGNAGKRVACGVIRAAN